MLDLRREPMFGEIRHGIVGPIMMIVEGKSTSTMWTSARQRQVYVLLLLDRKAIMGRAADSNVTSKFARAEYNQQSTALSFLGGNDYVRQPREVWIVLQSHRDSKDGT